MPTSDDAVDVQRQEPVLPERFYEPQPAPTLVLAPYYSPARSLLPMFLRRAAAFIVYGGSLMGLFVLIYTKFVLPRIFKTRRSIAKLSSQHLVLYTGFLDKIKEVASTAPDLKETLGIPPSLKTSTDDAQQPPETAPTVQESMSGSLNAIKGKLATTCMKKPGVELYMTSLEQMSTYVSTQNYRNSSFLTPKMAAAMDLDAGSITDSTADLVARCKNEVRALKGMLLNRRSFR